jgi:hypothetical protein
MAFNNAYTHTAKKQEAYVQFMNLTMQGNNIDDYIATFDWLVKCAGWNTSDQGVLEKFK